MTAPPLSYGRVGALSRAPDQAVHAYSADMETVGTWLVMIGAGLAVLQGVWVIGATGRKRTRLLREKAQSDAREEILAGITDELRKRWGDAAADISNYEEQPEYRSDPDLDRLRAQQAELLTKRDRWVRTWSDFGREESTKMRELQEVEGEWRRLWSQGVLGLLGGVLAFIGGVLIALGAC